MKITKYRLRKAKECYQHNRNQGNSVVQSIKLAQWFFHSGFNF